MRFNTVVKLSCHFVSSLRNLAMQCAHEVTVVKLDSAPARRRGAEWARARIAKLLLGQLGSVEK